MRFFPSIFRRRSLKPHLVLGPVLITEEPILTSLSPRSVEAQFQRAQKVVPAGILNPYEMQASADYAKPILDELKNMQGALKAEGHDFQYQLFQQKNSWLLSTNVRLAAASVGVSRLLDQRLSILFEGQKIKAWGDEVEVRPLPYVIDSSREVCEISGSSPDYNKINAFVKRVTDKAIKEGRLVSAAPGLGYAPI